LFEDGPFEYSPSLVDNLSVDAAKEKERTKAGAYAWRQRQRQMLPWAVGSLFFVLVCLVLLVLALVGYLPFWVSVPLIPTMLVVWFFLGKVLDRIDASWGEGARGEFQVGEELERLHKEGFYIFHDWYSGRGNVDHFVVGPQGIFAIETKSWKGEITAEDGKLLRDGRPVADNVPLKQAVRQAMDVRRLVADSSGTTPWVPPVLCFSRATVSCYELVGGVEVVGIGALNRTIANRQVRYSPQEVRTISRFLEKKLGLGPAASPGLPPEGPSGARKALERFLNLPTSTITLGFLFALSLLFPAQVSKALLGFAYLYNLLAEALGNLISN
jgi:hypothetical protein